MNINPTALFKFKEMADGFNSRHPKLSMFFKDPQTIYTSMPTPGKRILVFFEDNSPFFRKYNISGESTPLLFLNTQFQDLIDSFSKYDSEVSVTQSATPSYYGTFNRNFFYFESQNIRLPDQVETYIPHLVINRIFPWRRCIAIFTVITTVVRITKYPQPQSR